MNLRGPCLNAVHMQLASYRISIALAQVHYGIAIVCILHTLVRGRID